MTRNPSARRSAWLGPRPAGVALALGLAVSSFAGCARYARVEGTVVPPRPAKSATSAQVERTVVWVESKRAQANAEIVEVRLTDDGIEPAWLCVPEGTTLRFRNTSTVFHKPFSPSPKSGFVLSPVRPGETIDVRLAKPGEIRLFCELHPEAGAVLQVLPPGQPARVNGVGHFRLPSLPSGEYVVSYWHPDWGSGKRRVEVPANGVVEFELKF